MHYKSFHTSFPSYIHTYIHYQLIIPNFSIIIIIIKINIYYILKYVTDVDSELSKRAIAAMGSIALRVSSIAPEITMQIVDLVDIDISHVRAEAVLNLASIVRVFSHLKAIVVPCLSRSLRRLENSNARAAVVWMIGILSIFIHFYLFIHLF